MIILLLAQALAPQPALTPLPLPPSDWSGLPELAYVRVTPPIATLSAFVRDEVRAGRCVATGPQMRVDLAIMVAAAGRVRRIVPRAIQCPTVEQYASGLVSRMARGNVAAPGADTWYRIALTFTLAQ